jgi:hypothetical protein
MIGLQNNVQFPRPPVTTSPLNSLGLIPQAMNAGDQSPHPIQPMKHKNGLATSRKPSSGMLRRVALVRTDVSEESIATIAGVIRIGQLVACLRILLRLLVTANVVPSSCHPDDGRDSSSETSDLTRGTRRIIPEDGILLSHRRKNLKSYIALTGWTL